MDEKRTIQIPWQPPQEILVKKVGGCQIFSFIDRYGTSKVFYGFDIAYGVSLFQTKYMYSVEKMIVKNDWEEAIYTDKSGKIHVVIIHAKA